MHINIFRKDTDDKTLAKQMTKIPMNFAVNMHSMRYINY